ncbi:MAG: hypothetical protein LBE21_10210, partial [Pseudomonadales bacterium]|jgi:hypothetical protein|nr:hypothetical protein [Pseudomonadales bacterium]
VQGVFAALAEPPPELESAFDCYNYAGLRLNLFTNAQEPPYLSSLPAAERAKAQAQLRALATAVYEQGRARMERFFQNGQGQPGDASAHLYAMLCNNLGIRYAEDSQRYREAIELHKAGIAASPFQENYLGVLRGYDALDDYANVVKAAEDLWQFTAQHGEVPDSADYWVGQIFIALYHLGRVSEMPAWLERLAHWQRQNDEDEANLSHAALTTRLYFCQLGGAEHYRDMALAIYEPMRQQLQKIDDPRTLMYAGGAAYLLDREAEAKVFYEAALQQHTRQGGAALSKEDLTLIDNKLAYCNQVLRKPWWKIW